MKTRISRKKTAVIRLTHSITIPVLAILYIFTLTVGYVSLLYNDRINTEKQYNQISNELLRTQKSADVYLDDIVRTAINLRTNENIELFFLYPNLTDRQMNQITNTISATINAVPSVYSVYLVSDRSNLFAFFGKNSFKFIKQESFYDQTIFDLIKTKKRTGTDIVARKVYDSSNGQSFDFISFYSDNGVSGSNGPLTTVVANMKTSVVQNAMDSGINYGNIPMLVDRSGMVITAGGILEQYSTVAEVGLDLNQTAFSDSFGVLKISGKSYYVTCTPVDLFGTRIVSIIPRTTIDENIHSNRMAILAAILATLLTTTLIWMVFNRITKKPITELVKQANMMENDLLKGEEFEKFQVLRNVMLHGRMFSEERRREMLGRVSLPFRDDERVFLMQILMHNYINILRDKSGRDYEATVNGVKHSIEEIMSADTKCIVTNILSNGSFFVIAAPNNDTWERLPDIISNSIDSFTSMLPEVLGVNVNILYNDESAPFYNIYQLVDKTQMVAANRSFFESDTVINVHSYDSSDYSDIYRDVLGRVNEYLNTMRAEDFENADKLCEAVFDVTDVRELRFAWSVMTLTALPNICASYPKEISSSVTEILNTNIMLNRFTNNSEMKVWIMECHRLLCENIRAFKADKSYDLVSQTNEVVERNFSNPELNVAYVAAAVGVTPNYLSSVYKKLTSVKLTEHIQEVRLSNARELLVHSDMLVSEIARACGFAYNVGYFQLLFKKKQGLTPSQYKDKAAKEKDL